VITPALIRRQFRAKWVPRSAHIASIGDEGGIPEPAAGVQMACAPNSSRPEQAGLTRGGCLKGSTGGGRRCEWVRAGGHECVGEKVLGPYRSTSLFAAAKLCTEQTEGGGQPRSWYRLIAGRSQVVRR
jgi:hypothetical protein